MNASDAVELRGLISDLSDGGLSPAGTARLNELLRGDAVAQYAYLDHLMIDALLEREFSQGEDCVADPVQWDQGNAAPVPLRKRPIRIRRLLHLLIVALLVGPAAWWVSRWPQRQPDEAALPIWSVDFDRDVPQSGRDAFAVWRGDVADIVKRHSGITPRRGNGMLRFVRSSLEPQESCDVFRVINLNSIPHLPARGSGSVEVSASFNSIVDERRPPYAFEVAMYGCSDDPGGHPVDFRNRARACSIARTEADDDAGTWQQVQASMPLSNGVRFLVLQVSAIRTGGEPLNDDFPGQFVDDVQLQFVGHR